MEKSSSSLKEISDIFFDIEYGNQYTFFSARKNIKNYYNLNVSALDFDISFQSKIKNASGLIIDKCIYQDDNTITRNVIFHPDKNCYLFDFVSRFIVTSTSPIAYIANKKIEHTNSNLYHQYTSKNCLVEIPLNDKWKVVFREINSSYEKYFHNVFYLRDEYSENGNFRWIVHHRKIVNINFANLVIRSCNPRIEGVIPFDKFIPKLLKKPLFRIREKHYPNFPIMAVGVVNVDTANLYLNTEIRLTNV